MAGAGLLGPGDAVIGEDFDGVLAAARRGDERAWSRLYHDLAPVLTGYLRGSGVDAAPDVASETFLQVVRDLHRFDGDESRFRSWVFTIAHHRLIDHRRRLQRRPVEPYEAATLEAVLPPVVVEPDALDRVTSEELAAFFRCATPDQQEVLVLRFVAGLTMTEIAAALGKEVGAVKALQRRGLVAVRAALTRDEYPLEGIPALTLLR